LPTVWLAFCGIDGEAFALAVQGLPISSFGDCRDDVSPYSDTPAGLVLGDLLGGH